MAMKKSKKQSDNLHNNRVKQKWAQTKKENLIKEVNEHVQDIVKNREANEKEEVSRRIKQDAEIEAKEAAKIEAEKQQEEQKILEGITHFKIFKWEFDVNKEQNIEMIVKLFGNLPIVASTSEAKDILTDAYCQFVKSAPTPVQKLTNFVWLYDTDTGEYYEATAFIAAENWINLSQEAKGNSGWILQI